MVADPEGSVVADAVNKGSFKYENGSWLVEGIGEDHIPGNLNLDIIDEGIYVSDKKAFEMLNKLLQEEGILAGNSSGAAIAGLVQLKGKLKETDNGFEIAEFDLSLRGEGDIIGLKQ